MATPRFASGAAILKLQDRRQERRLSPVGCPRNQLSVRLDRLQAYRRALDEWDEAQGRYPMPQPVHFGLMLPNLRPSDVYRRSA